jgi:hypothetical protein
MLLLTKDRIIYIVQLIRNAIKRIILRGGGKLKITGHSMLYRISLSQCPRVMAPIFFMVTTIYKGCTIMLLTSTGIL